MIHFLGQFDLTLDDKGRFLFPAGFRKHFPDGNMPTKFILKRGIEQCLTMISQPKWESIMSELNQKNDFDPKVRQFKRIYLSGLSHVELDTSNRVLIRKELLIHANISREITIIGLGAELEIWDRATYLQNNTGLCADQVAELANAVMDQSVLHHG